MIKSIIRFIKRILDIEMQGFYYLLLIISRGFFLIINIPLLILRKIFKKDIINNTIKKVENLQENPIVVLLITILFSSFILYKMYLFIPDNEIVKVEDNSIVEMKKEEKPEEEKQDNKEEYNLYRKFSSYKLSDINFSELKNINSDVVAWLIVDGTNINYPIVKTTDNDFYLEHDINKMSTINGWTFMDYRNNPDMTDNNSIFYGHNLFNKTAFGSISNLFSDNWYNKSNHKIVVLTENNKYTYEIFSIYYSDPDSSYLKINYDDKEQYQEFLNSIKNRSERDFSIDISNSDNIITLSTCTDDNNGRKVVHAKLIKTE